MKRLKRHFPFSLTYALGSAVLLICGILQRRTPVLFVGLGFLVLAVIQGWMDLRDRRRGWAWDVHAYLLLGPCCALIGAFWLHKGNTWDDGLSVLLGLAFLAVAAAHIFHAIRDVRNNREDPTRNQD